MFIVSKRNFVIPRKDGSTFLIPKDFIGQIPDDVAQHWLVQAGLKDGTIAAPESAADKEIYKADQASEEKLAETDIRPDAEKPAKALSSKTKKK